MGDIATRRKALFWLLLGGFLALAVLPSIVLVESLTQYVRFISGWNPGVLRQTHIRSVPHRGRSGDPEMTLIFVDFTIRISDAKTVAVAGDFSEWKPVPMVKPKNGDKWEIQIPLPAGKHQYLFQVDGAWFLDPSAKATGRHGDQITSIKEVKP
ncbi:MAG: hypothetical protein HY078_10255 [Elusimicrobia bacterium]|nr:hypothetical protein [Elusimicrobiota bacterium]